MGNTLVGVKRRDNEDISSLLKRFKKRVEASGHLKELMDRKYYLKPSVIKRTQKNKIEHKRKIEELFGKK